MPGRFNRSSFAAVARVSPRRLKMGPTFGGPQSASCSQPGREASAKRRSAATLPSRRPQRPKYGAADLDPQATLTICSRRRRKTAPAISHFKVVWSDADALLDDAEMEGYDALFIDTPPSIETQPAAFQALLAKADLIVVPTRARSMTPIRSAVPQALAGRGATCCGGDELCQAARKH